MATTRRGFGLFAGIPIDIIRDSAAAAEAASYDSFWVNYAGTDGLAVLAQAATVTSQVNLGVGVVPLATRPAPSIVDGVRENQLPTARLLLGIGSSNPGALARMRNSVGELRAGPPIRIVLAALGPKMCQLAGEVADGVLFNWLTPEHAWLSSQWVQAGAEAAGRPMPVTYAYQRVALGAEASNRLAIEGGRYAAIPAYADHFARMGVSPGSTIIAEDSAAKIQDALATWNGIVDEVVVRGITANDSLDEIRELIAAAAPSSL